MKLNKSFILISLISIFLLLSIAAASAADNMDDQFMSDSASDLAIDDIDDIDDISDNSKDTNILSQGQDNEIIAEDSTGDGKTDTTVEAENKTYKYGEDIKIPVNVKDGQGNNVSIVKNNLNVTNGTDAINFTLDNESNIVLNQFDVGEYLINVNYLGNATFKASSTTVNLTIEKTNTTIENEDMKFKNGSAISFDLIIKGENNVTIPFTNSTIRVYMVTWSI